MKAIAQPAVEFVGTFFLVVVIGLVAVNDAIGALAPAAIGLTLAALIYAGGHISAAHYNPAVTAAFWMCGWFKKPMGAAAYWAAQLAATLAAVAVILLLRERPDALLLQEGPLFVAETIFTFLLVFVIGNVALAEKTADNHYYGLAIGATVAGAAWAVGDISGAALNPAVALAFAMLAMISWTDLPIYLAAQLLGAAVAVAVFRCTTSMR